IDIIKPTGARKTVVMDSKFFTGYRKNILDSEDIVVSIYVPKTTADQYFYSIKQSKRRDDDIAIVNMALNVQFNSKANAIFKFERGEVEYRKSLIISLFFKAYLTIKQKLQENSIHKKDMSGIKCYETLEMKSMQLFEKTTDLQPSIDPIGRPVVTVSAIKQSTGEAIYCDDIPRSDNELYLALVLSTKAHARIIGIDATEALQQKGVKAFYSAKDLKKENNSYGLYTDDEMVFADEIVFHFGQVMGAVVAESKKQAQAAARLIKVEYEEFEAILTIEQAIEKKSFFDKSIGHRLIENGNVKKIIQESYGCIEGSIRTGKQEHFYLEPHSTLAIPRDSDELEIFCSTQWPEKLQKCAAHLLNTTQSKISVRVKRIGGGFGGKEVRNLVIALPCVLAASRLGQPVRCVLDREQDMIISGTRNPILFKYKVGFTKEGYFTGLDVKAWLNAGCSVDYSPHVLGKALCSVQNAYNIPTIHAEGWVCKTNTVSNTAFRGFGCPQGLLVGELLIRQVADYLQMDYVDVMDRNLYREGHITYYNQTITNCNVERCFHECLESSDFHGRKRTVTEFNSHNRWRKRGITIVPTAFGVGFAVPSLNQAGAFINVYTDGSVLLTHGGVEMGQGLHTKMIQIAARVLEIPISKIHLSETSTDK
ncbi:unnamed protein product, partial [Sphagnum compactum]